MRKISGAAFQLIQFRSNIAKLPSNFRRALFGDSCIENFAWHVKCTQYKMGKLIGVSVEDSSKINFNTCVAGVGSE